MPKYGMLLSVRDELETLKLSSTFSSSFGISGIKLNNTSKMQIREDEDENNKEENNLLKTHFKADDLHSGRHLIYVNSMETKKDEIVFKIYPLREKHKRTSHLKIPIKVENLNILKKGQIPLKVSY